MNISEIYGTLKEMFPEAIHEVHEDPVGPYVVVSPGAGTIHLLMSLRDDNRFLFDHLSFLTARDFGDSFEVIYELYSYYHKQSIELRARVSRVNPRIFSSSAVWNTAEWHEREVYDMFGILFEGHPKLCRILSPDDWQDYPLRKDYRFPEMYREIRISFPGERHAQN